MIKQEQFSYTAEQIPEMVERLWQDLQMVSVMTFTGSLGAGKTTLIQGLLRHAGVTGAIQSPTFSYVHVYRVGEMRWYHFDLYRLPDMHAFIDAGFAEYLYRPGTKALIEWPEIIEPLVVLDACHVEIEYQGREERCLQVQCSGKLGKK